MNEELPDKVPLFGTWKRWYVIVVLFLAIQIVLFIAFTNTFS